MQPDKTNRLKSLLCAVLVAGISFAALADVKKGDTFPDLSKFKIEGTLPDIKGKVVLVDFWAPWCSVCKETFPVMNELQKKYGPQGLVIIAINMDEHTKDTDTAMKDFLKEHKADFTVVWDVEQKLADKVNVPTPPSSYIIGKDGKVLAMHAGYFGDKTKKEYEEELTAALK